MEETGEEFTVTLHSPQGAPNSTNTIMGKWQYNELFSCFLFLYIAAFHTAHVHYFSSAYTLLVVIYVLLS